MEPLTGERLARSRCTPAVWCVGEPDVCWGSKMSPPTERPTRQVLPRNRPPSRAAVDSALAKSRSRACSRTCDMVSQMPIFCCI